MERFINSMSDALLCVLNFMSKTEIQAAIVEGIFTLIAAGGALGAGVLAYKAATQQNRMAQNRQEVRKLAYKNHISIVLKDLRDDVLAIAQWADKNVDFYPPDKPLPKLSLDVPNDIKSTNWENHALLPEKAVKPLYRLYRATAQFQKMLDTIAERNLKITDDLPRNAFEIEQEGGRRTVSDYSHVGAFLENHPLLILEALKSAQDEIDGLHSEQAQTTAH